MEFNAAHLHLILNQIPVLGAVIAAVLLTLALFFRREVLTKASLWALGVAAVVGVPVYLSGEEAEDIVEELGVAHAVIESHEEAALLTLIVLGVLGLAALGALAWLRGRRQVPGWLTGTMWVAALVAGFLSVRTAFLGGQIRHTETRPPEVQRQLEAAAAEEGTEAAEAAPAGEDTTAGARDTAAAADTTGAGR